MQIFRWILLIRFDLIYKSKANISILFFRSKWIKAHFQCSLLQGTSLTDNQIKLIKKETPNYCKYSFCIARVHAKLKRKKNSSVFWTVKNFVEIFGASNYLPIFHLSDGVRWTVITIKTKIMLIHSSRLSRGQEYKPNKKINSNNTHSDW